MKILVSLSGGVDSTTLLAMLLDQGNEVTCINFNYGSKHNLLELQAAVEVAKHYNVALNQLDIRKNLCLFKSNLLESGGPIPEGHYEDVSMKQTIVPGRNLIMVSYMAGIAESLGQDQIAIGVHAGDHFIYPDCRPVFISAAISAVHFSSDRMVKLIAPFINKCKDDILKIGFKLKVPYHLTRTCYTDNKIACGKCGSCNERIESFKKIERLDPIKYAQEK